MQTTSINQASEVDEELSRTIDSVRRYMNAGYRTGSEHSLRACIEVGKMIALSRISTRVELTHIADNLAERWEESFMTYEAPEEEDTDDT